MFKIITKITDETREKRKIRGHNSINPWQKHAYDILEFFSPSPFIQKSFYPRIFLPFPFYPKVENFFST